MTGYTHRKRIYFYGGMYRDVNIIAVNKSHFDLDYYGGNGLKVTPEVATKCKNCRGSIFKREKSRSAAGISDYRC